MSNLNFTTINHTARLEMGLTANEYMVTDLIYHLANNPESEYFGWCYASKKKLGEYLGLTEQSIHTILNKLFTLKIDNLPIIEKNLITKHLKITKVWYNKVIIKDTKESLAPLKKVEPMAKESLVEDTKESLVYKDINNKDNNKDNNKVSTSTNGAEVAPMTKPNGFGLPELNKGMEFLLELRGKPINKVSLNRFALNRLVKKHGLDRSCRALEFAFGVVEDEFAPAITDFISLERKWENLEIYARRKMKKANAADIQGSIERGKQIGDIT